jgi:hypothetical protein
MGLATWDVQRRVDGLAGELWDGMVARPETVHEDLTGIREQHGFNVVSAGHDDAGNRLARNA